MKTLKLSPKDVKLQTIAIPQAVRNARRKCRWVRFFQNENYMRKVWSIINAMNDWVLKVGHAEITK